MVDCMMAVFAVIVEPINVEYETSVTDIVEPRIVHPMTEDVAILDI